MVVEIGLEAVVELVVFVLSVALVVIVAEVDELVVIAMNLVHSLRYVDFWVSYDFSKQQKSTLSL